MKKSKYEKYQQYREVYDEFDPEIFRKKVYSIKNKVGLTPYTVYKLGSKAESYSPQAVLTQDKYGLRTPYLRVPKTPGTVRICIFGGSTVWGSFAVRNEMTIPALLEKRLNDAYAAGRRLQVVNCGVGGFVATQELILMQLTVLKNYAPDMVIFFDGFNDFLSTLNNKLVGYPTMWKMYFDMMNKNHHMSKTHLHGYLCLQLSP